MNGCRDEDPTITEEKVFGYFEADYKNRWC